MKTTVLIISIPYKVYIKDKVLATNRIGLFKKGTLYYNNLMQQFNPEIYAFKVKWITINKIDETDKIDEASILIYHDTLYNRYIAWNMSDYYFNIIENVNAYHTALECYKKLTLKELKAFITNFNKSNCHVGQSYTMEHKVQFKLTLQ